MRFFFYSLYVIFSLSYIYSEEVIQNASSNKTLLTNSTDSVNIEKNTTEDFLKPTENVDGTASEEKTNSDSKSTNIKKEEPEEEIKSDTSQASSDSAAVEDSTKKVFTEVISPDSNSSIAEEVSDKKNLKEPEIAEDAKEVKSSESKSSEDKTTKETSADSAASEAKVEAKVKEELKVSKSTEETRKKEEKQDEAPKKNVGKEKQAVPNEPKKVEVSAGDQKPKEEKAKKEPQKKEERDLHLDQYETVQDSGTKDTKKKTKKQIQEEQEIKEWEDQVKDFVPENILSTKLLGDNPEKFYERIKKPTNLTIAFYVMNEEEKINFYLFDPRGKLIQKLRKKSRGFINVKLTTTGDYEFHLEGPRGQNIVQVTFATYLDIEENKQISQTHVNTMEENLDKTLKLLKDVNFNQQMITRKLTYHYESAIKHNRRIKVMSIVETIFMVLIFVGQWFYIRSLIKNM